MLVPDVAVDDAGCDSETARPVVISEASGSWLPRGEGVNRFRVEDSSSLRSLTVVEGSNCLPPKTSLEPVGNVVEAERNSRTLATVCVGLTLSGMPGDALDVPLMLYRRAILLLPPLVVTTIWMLSEEDEDGEIGVASILID